jgi:hypothetical protein
MSDLFDKYSLGVKFKVFEEDCDVKTRPRRAFNRRY